MPAIFKSTKEGHITLGSWGQHLASAHRILVSEEDLMEKDGGLIPEESLSPYHVPPSGRGFRIWFTKAEELVAFTSSNGLYDNNTFQRISSLKPNEIPRSEIDLLLQNYIDTARYKTLELIEHFYRQRDNDEFSKMIFHKIFPHVNDYLHEVRSYYLNKPSHAQIILDEDIVREHFLPFSIKHITAAHRIAVSQEMEIENPVPPFPLDYLRELQIRHPLCTFSFPLQILPNKGLDYRANDLVLILQCLKATKKLIELRDSTTFDEVKEAKKPEGPHTGMSDYIPALTEAEKYDETQRSHPK